MEIEDGGVDKILLNRHLQATSQACAVVSNVLDFDLVELWIQETGREATCVFIFATDEVSKDHPIVRTTATFYPVRNHLISPTIIRSTQQSASNLYWRNVESDSLALHPGSGVPFRTEFAYRVDTHSAAQSIFLLGFSRTVVKQTPNIVRFLEGISYAIYAAAFGIEFKEKSRSKVSSQKTAGGIELATGARRSADSSEETSIERRILDRKESSKGFSTGVKPFVYDLRGVAPLKTIVTNVNLTEVTGIRHIADGSHSHILVGDLRGKKVVVKILKEESIDNEIALHEYDMETDVLCRIGHPHVVELVGTGSFPRRFLVLEFLAGESLAVILERNVVKPGIRMFQKPSFTYLQLLQLGHTLAKTMDYLHQSAIPGATIVHRDLKPDNIVFTTSGVVKVIDFGLCACIKARDASTSTYEMTGNTGSKRYMAPEVALKKPYNEKADVYSFGIILWQMARDKVPYRKMTADEFYQKVVVEGERPKLDKNWPEKFSNLLVACWNARVSARPSFSHVVRLLVELIRDEGGSEKPNTPPAGGNAATSNRNDVLLVSKTQSTSALYQQKTPNVDRHNSPDTRVKKSGWF